MKVLMLPPPSAFRAEEGGIKEVVRHYHRYAPEYGIEYIHDPNREVDLIAVHAGSYTGPFRVPLVHHCHGLYPTADLREIGRGYWNVNQTVVAVATHAAEITVPSSWVGEIFQRDLHRTPTVIQHGVEWHEWQHREPNEGYVLWNKNRQTDVCATDSLGELARRAPKRHFLSTFAPILFQPNIQPCGVVSHEEMKRMVSRAGVYLSLIKETGNIGGMEACAAGVPILAWRQGATLDFVRHGVNGYLAEPGNYDDLVQGLEYCFRYRDALGANGREIAKSLTWQKAVEKVSGVYQRACSIQPNTAAIIIPSYNYGDKVGRAIQSAIDQDYPDLTDIIVVDDGSTDDGLTGRVVAEYSHRDPRVKYLWKENGGVATARNAGIAATQARFITCLDADDAVRPTFLSTTIPVLQADPSIGIAYTGLWYVKPDGTEGLSPWPGEYSFDRFLTGANQIPTCCTFRRELWARLGGYRQRYAADGAGEEDAEFWLRAGAYGWGAKKATDEGLFVYSWLSGRVSGNREHKIMDWRAWHPWVQDGLHPFASLATPQNFSHPVRQYDEPLISVVIPCSQAHVPELVSALDSLEAQTFRKWEAIVVWDFEGAESSPDVAYIRRAFPFIREATTHAQGAGAARNAGAKLARGRFLVFLDADDHLHPSTLAKYLVGWDQTQSIIYSRYIGKGIVNDLSKIAPDLRANLIDYNEKTKVAAFNHPVAPYDCQRAVIQPVYDAENRLQDVYHWCIVTCLIPKIWHDALGGFDEAMESWEDVDYHWRMARAGHCYTLLDEPLLVYRFYSGTRRQLGLQNHKKLLQYLRNKYKEIPAMPCSSCGGRAASIKAAPARIPAPEQEGTATLNALAALRDDALVKVKYLSGNIGQHSVIGGATRTNYGYRAGGDVFLVQKADAAATPHLFEVVTDLPKPVPQAPPPAPEPLVEVPAPPPPPAPPEAAVAEAPAQAVAPRPRGRTPRRR